MATIPKSPESTQRRTRRRRHAPRRRGRTAPIDADALADCSIPASTRAPPGWARGPGLQPPPDNSFDRREDFSAAHKARKSTRRVSTRRRRAATPPRRIGARSRTGEELGSRRRRAPPDPHAIRPRSRATRASGSEYRLARGRTSRPPAASPARPPPRGAGESAARRPRRNSTAAVDAASPAAAGEIRRRPAARDQVASSSRRATSRPRSRELVEGVKRHDRTQVLLGVTGSGKTFTMAKVIEATQRPGAGPGAEQDAGGAALRRVQELLSRQRGGIFRLAITITTSRKPTSRAPTPTSRRIPRSTSRSTACATRRRARCWSATTSSSSPRCRASTASARSRPIRR